MNDLLNIYDIIEIMSKTFGHTEVKLLSENIYDKNWKIVKHKKVHFIPSRGIITLGYKISIEGKKIFLSLSHATGMDYFKDDISKITNEMTIIESWIYNRIKYETDR